MIYLTLQRGLWCLMRQLIRFLILRQIISDPSRPGAGLTATDTIAYHKTAIISESRWPGASSAAIANMVFRKSTTISEPRWLGASSVGTTVTVLHKNATISEPQMARLRPLIRSLIKVGPFQSPDVRRQPGCDP